MPLLSLFFYFQKIIIFHKIYRFYKKERSTRETPSTRSPRPLQKNGLTWFFRLDSDNRIICLVITMLFIQYKSEQTSMLFLFSYFSWLSINLQISPIHNLIPSHSSRLLVFFFHLFTALPISWVHFTEQPLSSVLLFVPPWTAAQQASLSITKSQNILKLMSIESVMPSNHLIHWHPPSSSCFQSFPASGSLTILQFKNKNKNTV